MTRDQFEDIQFVLACTICITVLFFSLSLVRDRVKVLEDKVDALTISQKQPEKHQ